MTSMTHLVERFKLKKPQCDCKTKKFIMAVLQVG